MCAFILRVGIACAHGEKDGGFKEVGIEEVMFYAQNTSPSIICLFQKLKGLLSAIPAKVEGKLTLPKENRQI